MPCYCGHFKHIGSAFWSRLSGLIPTHAIEKLCVFTTPTNLVHVFGWCEKTEVPRVNPHGHREHMQIPHQEIKPKTFY